MPAPTPAPTPAATRCLPPLDRMEEFRPLVVDSAVITALNCSWRAVVRVQAKLLSKALRGEIAGYKGITTR